MSPIVARAPVPLNKPVLDVPVSLETPYKLTISVPVPLYALNKPVRSVSVPLYRLNKPMVGDQVL